MADSTTIIRNLRKKKYTPENLEQFSRYMMNVENRMAMLQLALNYPVFYECVSDLEHEKTCPACLKEAKERLVYLIERYVITDCSEAEAAEGIAAVEALRGQLTEYMKIVSGYGDCMNLYEYVVNRKEYCYRDGSHIAQITDGELTRLILEYLTSETDNQVVQLCTREILKQLPMRMTRRRFFQIVEEGLRAYIGSDQKSVDDLAEFLRQAAVVEEIDPKKLFSKLESEKESISAGLEQELDADRFEAIYDCMQNAFLDLNSYIDCVILEQGLVNNVYIVLLTKAASCLDVSEKQTCTDILNRINELFADSERPEIDDSMDELFIRLEGIQEHLQEQLDQYETVLEELPEGEVKSKWSEKRMHLQWCVKLHSASLFAELGQQEGSVPADEAYVMETAAQLCLMYQKQFQSVPKMTARGIMSGAIAQLPLFVRNYQEIEAYISSSLQNCTDKAEKLACTELLLDIVNDKEW